MEEKPFSTAGIDPPLFSNDICDDYEDYDDYYDYDHGYDY